MIYIILIIVQVLIALGLIVLILLQHGKGADAGAAFGSGASGTVLGAKGSANFMSRATGGLATLFMVVSLVLAYLVNGAGSVDKGSVIDETAQEGEKPTVTQQAGQDEDEDKDEKSQDNHESGEDNTPEIPD